jgi:hypothetical protein
MAGIKVDLAAQVMGDEPSTIHHFDLVCLFIVFVN